MDEYARARSDEWLWGQLITHRDGEMVLLDEPVRDGDCLELLPPIAGGELEEGVGPVERAATPGAGSPG